jgi:hypothetical protein
MNQCNPAVLKAYYMLADVAAPTSLNEVMGEVPVVLVLAVPRSLNCCLGMDGAAVGVQVSTYRKVLAGRARLQFFEAAAWL